MFKLMDKKKIIILHPPPHLAHTQKTKLIWTNEEVFSYVTVQLINNENKNGNICATCVNLIMLHAYNQGADQPEYQHCLISALFVLFCCFTSQVNSYGHGGTVSLPSHTFSLTSLNKQLTSTLCTYFHL